LETIKAASEFYGVAALKSYSHSHSDFFNLSSQFGLLGVVAFGLTFIAPIIIGQGLKKDHFWRALVVVLAFGFLLSGLSQTTLAHSSTATFYAFFMAILMGQLLRSFKN
jgi:O-antigen ligase